MRVFWGRKQRYNRVHGMNATCMKHPMEPTGLNVSSEVRFEVFPSAVRWRAAVSEHANKTGHRPLWNGAKFTDRDSHWSTRRIKEAIPIRVYPVNIIRDDGIEIPEAWIPTIKKHDRRPVHQRAPERTTSNRTSEETSCPRDNEDRTHQSQSTIVIQMVRRNQSTSWPDENLQ